jgi:hypothetical protein
MLMGKGKACGVPVTLLRSISNIFLFTDRVTTACRRDEASSKRAQEYT